MANCDDIKKPTFHEWAKTRDISVIRTYDPYIFAVYEGTTFINMLHIETFDERNEYLKYLVTEKELFGIGNDNRSLPRFQPSLFKKSKYIDY